MADEIKRKNALGEKTVFICPVGPVGQYPYFVEMVNSAADFLHANGDAPAGHVVHGPVEVADGVGGPGLPGAASGRAGVRGGL